MVNPDTGRYTCVDKDECSDASWNNCDINSVCENLVPSYQCICNEGWDNAADLSLDPPEILGTKCEDRNECDKDDPCANFGNCYNLIGLQNVWGDAGMQMVLGYSCNCSQGYIGDGYTSCLDVDECLDLDANNQTQSRCDPNSLCVNTGGNYLCLCNNGKTP